MSEQSDEYTLFKNEIHLNLQTIDISQNILYVSIAAIFAFTQNKALIFALLYIVIIPIYFITLENTYGMYKIGTYLMVFLEDEKYHWETRLFKVSDKKISRKRKDIYGHCIYRFQQ